MDKESMYALMEKTRQEHAEMGIKDQGTFKATTCDDGTMTFMIDGKWRGINLLMLVTEVAKRAYATLQGEAPDDELIKLIKNSAELGIIRAKKERGQ